VTLETPDRIRELQRKLYRKAKQEKEYRFYLLYDKVYRRDILSHAYRLVRANKGAPGVDGESFKGIEKKGGGVEGYLYENLHLYKIPTTAPLTQTAKATGRR
jgi:RNA-directed DNA polymerase